MDSLLPPSLLEYFDFVKAFDEFGRHFCLGDWTGKEAELMGRISVLSPEEARKLQEEGEAARDRLREKGGRYNDQDIDAINEENELTGELDHARMDDDPYDAFSWSKMLEKLSVARTYFRDKPAAGSPEYDELYKTYVRGVDVLRAMRALLADGKVQAFYKGERGRAAIAASLWDARELRIDVVHGVITSPKRMEGVILRRGDLDPLFAKLAFPKNMRAKQQAASDAQAALIRLMSNPRQPRLKREDVWSKFQQKWKHLSENDFELSWKLACNETKSGWNKSGAPKRSTVEQYELGLQMLDEILK